MEIKLSAGDAIQVPAGCKATIKENTIIIEEQKEFKEGDLLLVIYKNDKKCPFIYKGIDDKGYYKFHAGINYCGNVLLPTDKEARWGNRVTRYATEEEKRAFFDKLKAKGLRWNAETKTMERIGIRAGKREKYLIANRLGSVIELTEEHSTYDDMNYNSGNYYLPSERAQAEEDAKAIKAIFEKRLKVIQD